MNPMDYVDIGALTFGIVAAAFAAVAARWGWADRPTVAIRWHLTRKTSRWVPEGTGEALKDIDHARDPFEGTVKVYQEGSQVMRDVEFLAADYDGPKRWADRDEFKRSRFTHGSEPLTTKFKLPAAEDEPREPWAVVVYTTLRPLRRHAQRFNLRTKEVENLQWDWSSLRLRPVPNGRWWQWRLVRTRCRWVNARRPPIVGVPREMLSLAPPPPPALPSKPEHAELPEKQAEGS